MPDPRLNNICDLVKSHWYLSLESTSSGLYPSKEKKSPSHPVSPSTISASLGAFDGSGFWASLGIVFITSGSHSIGHLTPTPPSTHPSSSLIITKMKEKWPHCHLYCHLWTVDMGEGAGTSERALGVGMWRSLTSFFCVLLIQHP